MINRLNNYFTIVFLFFIVTQNSKACEISSSKEALKIIQTQKIYLFSILKDYLMIVMESNYKNPKKAKKIAIISFEANSDKLKNYLSNKDINKIKKEFSYFKKIVSKPFNISKGGEYFQKALSLEKNIKKLYLKIEKTTKTKLSKKNTICK